MRPIDDIMDDVHDWLQSLAPDHPQIPLAVYEVRKEVERILRTMLGWDALEKAVTEDTTN